MANVPEDLKYTKSHEWVRVENGVATVGITDHAQAELTDVVFVELPSVGKTVNAADPVAVVESVKTASDIYSPVSGEIVGANPALAESPDLVNSAPYEAGWFYQIKLSDATELDGLMVAEDYRRQIGG